MDELQKQIEAQWRAYGINPDIQGINRANELAQILSNYGITDLSKLGLKETPYEEMRGSLTGGGAEGGDYVEELYKGKRGQLTYDDKTFGRLGGFGSGGEKEFSDPFEYLTEGAGGRYGLGYSAAGKGWTDYEVVTGRDGKPVIVPRWGSSSDITPELIQFLSVAAMPFTGGLSSALGSTLGSQVAGQIAANALTSGVFRGLGNVAQGTGSFGSGFGKGAFTGALTTGIGQLASPYINTLASDASKLVGGGNFGDIAAGAVKGAVKSGIGAVITGDSVLDAILTGAAGGATSAGTDLLVKGTNSTLGEYLKDVPAPVKNAVLSAASAGILGKDIDKAVVNSFMRDMMSQVKDVAKTKGQPSGQAASAGYGGADIGYFDPDAETSPLPDWALDPYKDEAGELPSWALDPYAQETKPGEYYAGLDKIIDEWDEADIIPGAYATTPKTSMTPVEMSQFLEANIDDPGTIETLMQDYFPELYTQRIETTATRGDTGTAPRSIRDVGNVTQIQPGEKLDGTTVVEPDLSKNLPGAQVDKKTTPGKQATPAKTTDKKGPGIDALLAALAAMNPRPEKEEEQQAGADMPFYDDLMYGLTSRYA